MKRQYWTLLVCAGVLGALAACSTGPERPPNVLFVVWDTVRADRLGPYGHDAPTTPHLDRWVADARVFEDCLSTAGYTLPSHASMFTGLHASEHCTHNGNKSLGQGYTTLAELLRDAGYRTYLYSANPHVSEIGNLAQGFDLAEHPWSPRYRARAEEIIRDKLPQEDRSNDLRDKYEAATRGERELTPWNITAAGELAEQAVLDWLEASDGDRPFFVFLNYMEAHRPRIPRLRHREQVMTEAEIDASYRVDRSWLAMWEYTFGVRDYTAEELAITRATYDAALVELDELFHELLRSLDAGGHLDDTVVVLTADHGEHLGEQHMLDHQYSVYQPLLRIPLIVHYPPRFQPGRERRPVMNFDLFPTLLELAGVEPPPGLTSEAQSLLEPREHRLRFAEEPSPANLGIGLVRSKHPDWDPAPWKRSLRSLVRQQTKLIWGSDGRHELFDLAQDPLERRDLAAARRDTLREMHELTEAYHASLRHCSETDADYETLSPAQRELLRSLGYVE